MVAEQQRLRPLLGRAILAMMVPIMKESMTQPTIDWTTTAYDRQRALLRHAPEPVADGRSCLHREEEGAQEAIHVHNAGLGSHWCRPPLPPRSLPSGPVPVTVWKKAMHQKRRSAARRRRKHAEKIMSM